MSLLTPYASACATAATALAAVWLAPLSTAAQSPPLEPAAFQAALEGAGAEAILLDCRTPEEFAEGALPAALNYDYLDSEFAYRVDSLSRDRSIFVYCAAGSRSAGAAELLDAIGFGKVFELAGGKEAYDAAQANTE